MTDPTRLHDVPAHADAPASRLTGRGDEQSSAGSRRAVGGPRRRLHGAARGGCRGARASPSVRSACPSRCRPLPSCSPASCSGRAAPRRPCCSTCSSASSACRSSAAASPACRSSRGPTAGYLVSFVLAALVLGLASRSVLRRARRPWWAPLFFVATLLTTLLIVHPLGIAGLMLNAKLSLLGCPRRRPAVPARRRRQGVVAAVAAAAVHRAFPDVLVRRVARP